MITTASNFWLFLLAGTIGVISPSGGEIGPFLATEQAALIELIPESQKKEQTPVLFAFYNLIGYLATALGGIVGGGVVTFLSGVGVSVVDTYRVSFYAYSFWALMCAIVYFGLSSKIESPETIKKVTEGNEIREQPTNWKEKLVFMVGLKKMESAIVLLKLSGLFILDAFAGWLQIG